MATTAERIANKARVKTLWRISGRQLVLQSASVSTTVAGLTCEITAVRVLLGELSYGLDSYTRAAPASQTLLVDRGDPVR